MNNSSPDDRLASLQTFKVCRDEVMHEQSVLSSRISSYITSQSFLISAYAVSMSNVNPRWGNIFRLAFPLVLCLVGFLLSVRAHPGIADATEIIKRWHERQDQLLDDHPELTEYQVLRRKAMDGVRSRDQLFALSAAYIFAATWVILGIISATLYFTQ